MLVLTDPQLAAGRTTLPGAAQSLLVTFQSLAILIAPLVVVKLSLLIVSVGSSFALLVARRRRC
jgi:hypothetical protein